jgi:flagellar basal-body rod protein FlgB
MLDALANDFSFSQHALDLQSKRAEVIAGNIANADTPNYKAVDFDFPTALKSAMQGSGNSDGGTSSSSGMGITMAATDPRHFTTTPDSGDDNVALQYRSAVQRSIDGNTVDMDVERGAFMDNAMQYQATLTFLNSRISTLTSAIKD